MSTATVAGLLLIVVSIAFNAAFALLAARFDYPDILREPTADVLTKFRAGGTALVLLWWAFALTALLMVPLVVLLSSAISDADPTLARHRHDRWCPRRRRAVPRASFAGHSSSPTSPAIAADPDASPARREAVDIVFQSFNRYLGVAVGEHLGYLLTGAWTTLTGIALTQTTATPSWIGVLGMVIGPVLMLCSLEFVGRHETSGMEARRTPHPDDLHRVVAVAHRHRRRNARLAREPEAAGRLGRRRQQRVLGRDALQPPLGVQPPHGAAQLVVARDRGAQVAHGVVAAAEQRGEAAEVAVDRAVAGDRAAGRRGAAGVGQRGARRRRPRGWRRRARRTPRRTRPGRTASWRRTRAGGRSRASSVARARSVSPARGEHPGVGGRVGGAGRRVGDLVLDERDVDLRRTRRARAGRRTRACRRTGRRCGRPRARPASLASAASRSASAKRPASSASTAAHSGVYHWKLGRRSSSASRAWRAISSRQAGMSPSSKRSVTRQLRACSSAWRSPASRAAAIMSAAVASRSSTRSGRQSATWRALSAEASALGVAGGPRGRDRLGAERLRARAVGRVVELDGEAGLQAGAQHAGRLGRLERLLEPLDRLGVEVDDRDRRARRSRAPPRRAGRRRRVRRASAPRR